MQNTTPLTPAPEGGRKNAARQLKRLRNWCSRYESQSFKGATQEDEGAFTDGETTVGADRCISPVQLISMIMKVSRFAFGGKNDVDKW